MADPAPHHTDQAPPHNDLERIIMQSADDQQVKTETLDALVNARVFVLLNKEWDGRGDLPEGAEMMFVTDGPDTERPMLALFTSRPRLEAFGPRGEGFSYGVQVDAAWAFLGVPEDCGAYANPNSIANFRVGPEAVVFITDVIEKTMAEHRDNAPPSPT
jgi:hypothetical protein